MNLSPTKIRGVKLPKNEIGNGYTSLVYHTSDPNVLEVYTIERMKILWWLYGLNIIEYYDDDLTAVYEGIEQKNHYSEWSYARKEVELYHCFVRRLDPMNDEQRKLSKRLRRQIDSFWGSTFNYENTWKKIANEVKHESVQKPARWIMGYDCYDIIPDFGPGDFMSMDGELVCLDPFHHRNLSGVMSIRKYIPFN